MMPQAMTVAACNARLELQADSFAFKLSELQSLLDREHAARVKAQKELSDAQWVEGFKDGWGSGFRSCPRCSQRASSGHATNCPLAAALEEPK